MSGRHTNFSGITITCGSCGNTADIDLFTAGYPLGHFQCPACGCAVRKVKTGVQQIGTRLIPTCKLITATPIVKITGA